MSYQQCIGNLTKIQKVKSEDDLVAIYLNVSKVVRHLVHLKYAKLDDHDAIEIADKIATDLVYRYKTDTEFFVTSWPSYLGLLILDEYKKNYKDHKAVISISQFDPEYVDEELQLVAEEIDTDTLVDFKSSIEDTYLTYQKVVNSMYVSSEETKRIIERIVVFAATSDESILRMLSEPYKRIASSQYAILRRLFRKNKEEGLIVSRIL